MGKMIWPLALCLAMASAWADDDEHHERHDKRRPRQLSSAGAPAVWNRPNAAAAIWPTRPACCLLPPGGNSWTPCASTTASTPRWTPPICR